MPAIVPSAGLPPVSMTLPPSFACIRWEPRHAREMEDWHLRRALRWKKNSASGEEGGGGTPIRVEWRILARRSILMATRCPLTYHFPPEAEGHPLVTPSEAEGSGPERDARHVRGQMSRLRST